MNSDKTLLARVESLERQNRRMKQGAVLALIALASIGLVAATLPNKKVIEAETFVLKGPSGETRGMWSAAIPSMTYFSMDRKIGRSNLSSSIGMGIAPDGSMEFAMTREVPDTSNVIEKFGVPESEEERNKLAHSLVGHGLSMGVLSNGETKIIFDDKNNDKKITLEVDENGFPIIGLRNPETENSVFSSVTDIGPSLKFFREGVLKGLLGFEQKASGLVLYEDIRQRRLEIVTGAVPHISMYRRNGSLLWEAP